MAATSLEQFLENYRDTVHRLFLTSNAANWHVPESSFADALRRSCERRFSSEPGPADRAEVIRFLDSLHICDLALAVGCFRGDAEAWDHLVSTYRGPIDAFALAGDSPPDKDDFAPLVALIRNFKQNDNGTLSAVNVLEEEHARFEREFSIKVNREPLKKVSPLPAFARQAQAAYKALAAEGGGSIRSLSNDESLDQQVMILVFGDRWQEEVRRYASR